MKSVSGSPFRLLYTTQSFREPGCGFSSDKTAVFHGGREASAFSDMINPCVREMATPSGRLPAS